MNIEIIGEYGIAYHQLIDSALKAFWITDPVLRNIQIQISEHAGPIRNVPGDFPLDQPMMLAQYKAWLTVEDIKQTKIDEHTMFIMELARDHELAVGPTIFGNILQICEATGNTVDAQGMSPYDAIIESIRKMDVSFDDDGNHSIQIVVNPETAKALFSLKPTPEQERRVNELIEEKRVEYNAKKRTRRLSSTSDPRA